MTLSPSDVVMIPFPYTDLKTSKRRPVLVLRETDEYGDFLAVALPVGGMPFKVKKQTIAFSP